MLFMDFYLGTILSVDQFLNKLPQSVIRDGKIIDIRGSISDAMKVHGVPEGRTG